MAEPPPPDPESEAAQEALLSWLGEQLAFDAAARIRQQELEAAARQEGHAQLLKRSVTEWNMWRQLNPEQWVDLGAVDLKGMWLAGARLNRTAMISADLRGANLARAYLGEAHLTGAKFDEADLTGARMQVADLNTASFVGANLTDADLMGSMALAANFTDAIMERCSLRGADLAFADFSRADLRDSDLHHAVFVGTTIERALLSGSAVHGISAWDIKGEPAEQLNLTITPRPPPEVPTITVDDLRVAQLVYLMLGNVEFRNVIDTVASKSVLILGRFAGERKAVLDAVRDELRRRNYVAMMFDFERPGSRDLTETVSTLAHLARFVIADLSAAKSVGHELMATVPNLPSVPFQPIIVSTDAEYAMFERWTRYPWVLPTFRYEDPAHLIASLTESLLEQVEAKVTELRREDRLRDPAPEAPRLPERVRPEPPTRSSVPPEWLRQAEAQRRELAVPKLPPEDEEILRGLVLWPREVERGPRSAEAHLFLGNCYVRVSDDYAALAEYSAAIGVDPTFADAYFNRGYVYKQVDEIDRAIEDFGRAIAFRDDFLGAYYNRGVAYSARADYERAIADFTRVLALDPEAADAYHARGFSHFLHGALEHAISDYDQALERDPELWAAYRDRAFAYEERGEDQKAIGDYGRALEHLGEDALLLTCRGHTYLRAGSIAEALSDFDRALDLDPDSALAYHGRGLAHRDFGDFDLAIEDLTRAAGHLDAADVYADRGYAYASSGRLEQAVEDYNRALQLNPDHVPAHFNRACALSLQQKTGSVVADLTRAFELDPSLSENGRLDPELEWARREVPEVRKLLGL